jgi:outer membrane protein assembly factor BamB
MNLFRLHPCFVLLVLLGGLEGHAASSWPQFRGPNGQGVAERDRPPTEFGPGTNLLWKTRVPGGVSSPCIWGDRIFLTAFSTGKLESLCLDRRDGHMLWRQVAPAETKERANELGSPASATPATDGRRVYVTFSAFGLLAYDFEGREQWRKPLPVPNFATRTGTSPVLVGQRVMLNCDQDGGPSFLLAVDSRDGHRSGTPVD